MPVYTNNPLVLSSWLQIGEEVCTIRRVHDLFTRSVIFQCIYALYQGHTTISAKPEKSSSASFCAHTRFPTIHSLAYHLHVLSNKKHVPHIKIFGILLIFEDERYLQNRELILEVRVQNKVLLQAVLTSLCARLRTCAEIWTGRRNEREREQFSSDEEGIDNGNDGCI